MASRSAGLSPIEQRFPARTVRTALLGLFFLAALLWFFSRALLSTNFLPHWYCYVGNKKLVWTNVISDLAIGLSYVVISLTLVWLVRRAGRSLPYAGFFWAFGLFIVSCGATHFMEVITVWKPVYWLSGAVKIITAVSSVGTAAVLLFAADDIVAFVRTAREAAIRQGSNRYRALIRGAPMAIVGTDLRRRITDWNPAAEQLFGWRADEAVGQLSVITPPDLDEERLAMRQKVMAGQVIRGAETFRVNRKGNRIPVSFSVAPVHDENGDITGTIGIFEDISERRRIQAELQEKTAVLSAVAQALNSFLDTGDWKAASKHLLSFAIQQSQSEYGFLGVILDGPVLRVLAHDGLSWDVRLDRKIYDEKMKQEAEHGYFEINHVHNLLGQVITKGEITVSNSPRTDPRSGGLPKGHPKLDCFLGVPIFKGSQAVGLIAVANRSGGYTGQEVSYLETMSHATGVLYDNYRQHLKRVALEELQERLKSQVLQSQKMEVLGRLAGGVAHDFNNMLMVLTSCSELLERSLPSGSPALGYLDQIQRTTNRASAVTAQLLAFSRKQVLRIQPMNLHESLTASQFMLRPLLGSDIQLTFRPNAHKPWLQSDPTQMEQVVANLAINARDAMPKGGALTISTRNATSLPEGSAAVSPGTEEWVVLEVADTGVGMDQKTRAQIFEPFFTTKAAGKGTGLGLATVYGIVQQSSGYIHVVSALGEGTRFELFFPCVEPLDKPGASSPSPLEIAAPSKGGVVLLADDETALRQAVAEILRSSGYKVLEAESASEALEMAQKHTEEIDILLTDIVMPGLRGTELALEVAQIHPEIKVIYMSGYAEGFSDTELPPHSTFLQKPFRFATLLDQLKLLRRKA